MRSVRSGDRIRSWEARFFVVSLLVLAAIGFAAQAMLGSFVTQRVLALEADKTQTDLKLLGDALTLFDWSRPLDGNGVASVDLVLKHSMLPIYLLKVWSWDGTVLYSTEHSLIGHTFPRDQGLTEALAGRSFADRTDLTEAENAVERGLGLKEALEAYIPISVDGKVVGAFETYSDASALNDEIAALRLHVDAILFGGLAALWIVIWFLAHGMASNLRRQNRDLTVLHDALQRSLQRISETLSGALAALADAVEAKDEYVAGHVERVAAYAALIADEMALSGPARDAVLRGAVLHDIGKMAIPDAILGKPAALDDEERQAMQTHAERGEAIVRRIPGLEAAGPVVRHHHERWEGGGYPDGLSGHDIPLGARIVAVADAFDAMTTDRVYRRAFSYVKALQELEREAGAQFDPQVVTALKRALLRMAERPAFGLESSAVPRAAAEAAAAAASGGA